MNTFKKLLIKIFNMFTKIKLDYDTNLFQKLCETTDFENIVKGRQGAVIVDYKNELIPLVRTTTKYSKPVQKFHDVHHNIIEQIKKKSQLKNIYLNNALIEIYNSKYYKMGFHSDQALDLADDSFIAIYSCYEKPLILKPSNSRKLIIKNKITKELSKIVMDHNSVILFSLSTNSKHLHKIILENTNDDNRWLGITFRLSKTFLHYVNNNPFFYQTNNILKIANDEECKKFYKLRSEENKSSQFEYPEINYTISTSDIMRI